MNILEVYEAAEIDSLPINPASAAAAIGIKVVSYGTIAEEYERTVKSLYEHSRFGFSFKAERGPVIAINENSCGERRRRFTLAHELGHCVLGHLEYDSVGRTEEREADKFAADFLAPQSVLNFCGVSSAKEIALICGISDSAAGIVFREISEKRHRGFNFLEDSQDAAIMRRFSRYITKYLERRESRSRQNSLQSQRNTYR